MILVVVAPLLAFSAFLVLRSAAHEQEIMANGVRERTREAAATIDHELAALRSRLFILAGSRQLQTGDFAGFRDEVLGMAGLHHLGVVLRDSEGRQIVNTGSRFGEPPPVIADPDAVRRVVENRLPDVSTLSRDPVTGDWLITIDVPVLRDALVAYVLSLNIAPLLPQLMSELNLPPEWIVTIGDRSGQTIARSREASRFVGQMGRPAVLERFRAAEEGWFPLVSRDDVPVYNAFAHVRFSGWTVAVGIPDAVLFAPVRHSTSLLIMAGGFILALALLLGLVIGQRIAGAITGLAGYAEGLGRGKPVSPPASGIQEADTVAHSLYLASEQLRQNAQERGVLLDRMVTAQEAERKRIARELHDSLGQYLSALRLGFSAIEPECAANPIAEQRLAELKGLAGDLGRELNRIAWELRPMALDDLGLRRAIIQYLEEWAERSRLQIDLEINLDDRRLPQTIETALFRVLQEAIGNVIKHAGASCVGVIVAATDTEIRLIVEDDGRGFEMGSGVAGLELGLQHLGLLGVRERLALVGGSLDVESGAQGGTTVYVRIPL